nr:ATP-dependent helicase [Chitinophaga oryziterrae]
MPLPVSNSNEKLRFKVWTKMLRREPAKLTFKMIMRLAELIINSNPKIKDYLQKTYHFVFLDEFQDATNIQYDFFKSCFLGSSTAFTAVGDGKQRIMVWAGALQTVFEDYIAETGAVQMPLRMNFRSAPRLVAVLNHLTEHLLGKKELAIPSSKWDPDRGTCEVWVFENPVKEQEILFKSVEQWIKTDGIDPREICILVKQQLDIYAGNLIKYFNDNGIKARDENKFQDLLTQEVCLYIIHTLYLIFGKRSGESKDITFRFLRNLNPELQDDALLKLEYSYQGFITATKSTYDRKRLQESDINSMIDDIVNYAGKDGIRYSNLQYKNATLLEEQLDSVKKEFAINYTQSLDVLNSLDMLIGKDTIPVMTIHKSKGLEYHTIVFIGLEDGAFWSFQKQPDEDKCAFFVALSRAKEQVFFTFSKEREGKFGTQRQSTSNIQVIFDELRKSGIVKMVPKVD